MSVGKAKVPRQPPPEAAVTAADIHVTKPSLLWRIHVVEGVFSARWDGFRTLGPLASRWDPHPEPYGDHTPVGVLYAGLDLATCCAEVFQGARVVAATSRLALTGWRPTRALRLLDLTGRWPVRNGAAASLHAAPRSTTRGWARWVAARHPSVDGLYVRSTMTGDPMVVLFAPAAIDSMPALPSFTRRLSHPALAPYLTASAAALRWGYRGS